MMQSNEDIGRPDLRRRSYPGKVATTGEVGADIAQAAQSVAARTAASPARLPAIAGVSASVALTVNGRTHQLTVDTRTTLLDALRDHLQLTGTKKGCDRGQCGACTVLLDDRRVNACLALAVMHDGARIETVEGLADSLRGSALQQAFLDRDGFQCGFCTPGQLCSAKAMLGELEAGDPSMMTSDLRTAGPIELSEAEIRERMSGNLCRCGAYPNIVAAIGDVAKTKE